MEEKNPFWFPWVVAAVFVAGIALLIYGAIYGMYPAIPYVFLGAPSPSDTALVPAMFFALGLIIVVGLVDTALHDS